MKESAKERLKSTIYESTLSTANAVPLPHTGKDKSQMSGVRYLISDVSQSPSLIPSCSSLLSSFKARPTT